MSDLPPSSSSHHHRPPSASGAPHSRTPIHTSAFTATARRPTSAKAGSLDHIRRRQGKCRSRPVVTPRLPIHIDRDPLPLPSQQRTRTRVIAPRPLAAAPRAQRPAVPLPGRPRRPRRTFWQTCRRAPIPPPARAAAARASSNGPRTWSAPPPRRRPCCKTQTGRRPRPAARRCRCCWPKWAAPTASVRGWSRRWRRPCERFSR